MERISLRRVEECVELRRCDLNLTLGVKPVTADDKINLFGVSARQAIEYVTGTYPIGHREETDYKRVENKLRENLPRVMPREKVDYSGLYIVDDALFHANLSVNPKNSHAFKLVCWIDASMSLTDMEEVLFDDTKSAGPRSCREQVKMLDLEKALANGPEELNRTLDRHMNQQDRGRLRGVPFHDFIKGWVSTRGIDALPMDIERVKGKLREFLPRVVESWDNCTRWTVPAMTSGLIVVPVQLMYSYNLAQAVPERYLTKIKSNPSIKYVLFWLEKGETLLDIAKSATNEQGVVAKTSKPNSFVKEVPSGCQSVTITTDGPATVTINFQEGE